MSKWNYFNLVTVDGYAFSTYPQINFHFIPNSFTFLNRGHKTIQYSFDGSTLHGDLNPNDDSSFLKFSNRQEDKVWFRGLDGYGTIRVEAWGNFGR